jgi:hypothetical protein
MPTDVARPAQDSEEPDPLQQESERIATLTATGSSETPTDSEQADPAPEDQAAEARQESEPPPATEPAEPEPPPALQEDPAAKARRELLEAQRAAEARYVGALEPVEAKVASWDFAAAWQAAETVQFDEEDLAARLAARREEIRLMGDLKQRIITAINEAKPPLQKGDLLIRGMGGQIASAGEAGITAQLLNGNTETSGWTELGSRATGKLLELAVDPTNGRMLLAGALLATALDDAALSQAYFSRAKEADADMSACLVSLAAKSLSEAIGLLDRQQYASVGELLARIEAEYGATHWFAASSPAIDAVRKTAEQGLYEMQAETLYAEAVDLLRRKRLFDLRDVMNRLRTEYGLSRAVHDRTRSPSSAELETSIAGLGRKVVVRLDGKGDFTAIQAAIDALPEKSLIEIQDNGPYHEQLDIPDTKAGMTIRGGEQWRPLITSAGAAGPVERLVNVVGADVTLERLVLVHSNGTGENPRCLDLWRPRFSIRTSLICTDAKEERGLCVTGEAVNGTIEDSLVLATSWLARTTVRNSVFAYPATVFDPCRIQNCTFLSELQIQKPGAAVFDSLITSTHVFDAAIPDLTMANCSIFGPVPHRGSRPLGTGYSQIAPRFVDPSSLDCRLQPDSQCKGKASDGGDLGCRYTPEVLDLARHACELRARNILGF